MVRKCFRWLGHLVPQVLGQNQFQRVGIKQDMYSCKIQVLESKGKKTSNKHMT